MKKALLCWLAAGCLPALAGLTFDQPSQTSKVGSDTESATFDFAFSNTGDKPVTITQVDGGCECLGTSMQGGKVYYQPGEKGLLRTKFNLEAFSGAVNKELKVWVEGDAPAKPSYVLQLHVDIPTLVDVSPKTLTWIQGEAPEPKKVTITVNGSDPVRAERISNGDGKFTGELKTIEEGRKYELTVTPVSTAEQNGASLRIDTDSVAKKYKLLAVFAVIVKPGKAAAVKSN